MDPFTEQEVALTLAEDQIVVAVIDTGIDEHMRGDGWLNEVGRRSNDNVDLLDVFPSLGTPALPILDSEPVTARSSQASSARSTRRRRSSCTAPSTPTAWRVRRPSPPP